MDKSETTRAVGLRIICAVDEKVGNIEKCEDMSGPSLQTWAQDTMKGNATKWQNELKSVFYENNVAINTTHPTSKARAATCE